MACERCGRRFGCDAAASCWCRQHALGASTRARLAGAYEDCLCPACLAELTPLTVADPAA